MVTLLNLSFIFDDRIRRILERDYVELQQLNSESSTKSVIVLSGGILEGLFLDALVASKTWTFARASKERLQSMIKECQNKGIITEDRLSNVTRNYRNLIHPGCEIRENVVFDRSEAELARAALEIIGRDVEAWSLAEAQRKGFRTLMTEVDQDQVNFLRLFASPSAEAPDQFDHPFLSHSVYRAAQSLIRNGVLLRDGDSVPAESKEPVRLAPNAISPVEELVIKGPIRRSSIVLDLRNIAASRAGGSGAPPQSSVRRFVTS